MMGMQGGGAVCCPGHHLENLVLTLVIHLQPCLALSGDVLSSSASPMHTPTSFISCLPTGRMFGDGEERPSGCPNCSFFVDQLNGVQVHVSPRASIIVVAKASPMQLTRVRRRARNTHWACNVHWH